MSQNGYISFDNYTIVLNQLNLVQVLGSGQAPPTKIRTKIQAKMVDKHEEELEFAKQLWNKVNCFLFNFVDSIILIDFLTLLFQKDDLTTFIEEVSRADGLPKSEIENNYERNKDIVGFKGWTLEVLQDEFNLRLRNSSDIAKKWPMKTRIELHSECTFQPQTGNSSDNNFTPDKVTLLKSSPDSGMKVMSHVHSKSMIHEWLFQDAEQKKIKRERDQVQKNLEDIDRYVKRDTWPKSFSRMSEDSLINWLHPD